jgi:hypothetical protein
MHGFARGGNAVAIAVMTGGLLSPSCRRWINAIGGGSVPSRPTQPAIAINNSNALTKTVTDTAD